MRFMRSQTHTNPSCASDLFESGSLVGTGSTAESAGLTFANNSKLLLILVNRMMMIDKLELC